MSKNLIDQEPQSSTLLYSKLIDKIQAIPTYRKFLLLLIFSFIAGGIIEYMDSSSFRWSEAMSKCLGSACLNLILGGVLILIHQSIYPLIKLFSNYTYPVALLDIFSSSFLASGLFLLFILTLAYFT
jgi:hypothetical protein